MITTHRNFTRSRVVEKYSGYGEYQEKTDREIPLIWLDPIDSPVDDEDS